MVAVVAGVRHRPVPVQAPDPVQVQVPAPAPAPVRVPVPVLVPARVPAQGLAPDRVAVPAVASVVVRAAARAAGTGKGRQRPFTPNRPAISWMNCQATRPERAPRVTDHSTAAACNSSRPIGSFRSAA